MDRGDGHDPDFHGIRNHQPRVLGLAETGGPVLGGYDDMTDQESTSPMKLALKVLWSTFWTGFPIKLAFALLFLSMDLINFEARIALAFVMVLASPVTVFALPILMMGLDSHIGEGAGIWLLFLLCMPIDIWAYGVVARTYFLDRLQLEPPDGIGLSLWIKTAVVGALYLPILWLVVGFTTETAISVAHSLFEMDFLKGVPVAERIGIELTLWGTAATVVLLVMLLIGLWLVGRVIGSATKGAQPASDSYQRRVMRWDLMRVPSDQGLMLTAFTGTGIVLSLLFWSALPVTTPHPHDCCKKPEVKAKPPYKPLDALTKDEKLIAQLTTQLDALEKKKAEEEGQGKNKGKRKAGKEADKAPDAKHLLSPS
jgi:hypothetical protein